MVKFGEKLVLLEKSSFSLENVFFKCEKKSFNGIFAYFK
jgi:hypothetical protein